MLQGVDPNGPSIWNKEDVKKENKELIREITKLQRLLYADGKRSLLIILQGIDAAGKDGTVRAIFSGINPLGCNVFSFKPPTEEELAHDFLWRIHSKVPAKGMIHIFNRSHYEDILVPSVEGYLDQEIIDERFDQINHFEKLITSNGTKILKFYLHISKEEQLDRLTERIENPTKHWKHNDGDWESRKKWDDYMNVYEQLFSRCNDIPWHIVPANRNWVKVNYVAREILHALQEMELSWPGLETERFK
ncbi:MAG: polyphosphate kinase [Flavobacteriales bacterium]|nr:polyphosphate kinase [Flavobacteriales bacterium]